MNISSQKIENRNSLRETKDNQKFIPTGTFESFLPWGYILRSLEMAGIGYWHIAINEDGENKLSVNASFLSMAGLDSEQFPKTFEDFVQTCVHPDDRDSSYNTALMNGSGSEGSYDFKARLFNRRTRSWRWVHSFGEVTEKASDGRPLTILGCIVDIHEAHQSSLDLAEKEEALRQERQRVDAMIDAAGLIIWDWDLENETIRYGDEVYSIQGLSEAKHFSEPWSEAISLEDQARVLEARRRHLSGETSHYEAELQVRRPSGEIFWAHDKGRVVAWDAKGRPTRMMGATSDITSRTEGAQALLDSRLRLEQVL